MLTRREFIKLCMTGMASMSLSKLVIPEVAEALIKSDLERPVVIWLEATTCAGDYFSFMNSLNPDLQQILFETIEINFSNTMMVAEGHMAIEHLEKISDEKWGEYILVVEGTIPTGANGKYGMIGHRRNGEPVTDLAAVTRLAKGAKYILAAGSCASFGGPYAAEPNPTQSKPVHQVVDQQVINVPGCPVHPDWIVGTLSHAILYGVPDLDAWNRPTLFFGSTIHHKCPRREDFENSNFAEQPGDSGCLYKIGCKGPVTYSDCPTRQWIGTHDNWPVETNTPCIGCVSPYFPDQMSPFFEHLPDIALPGIASNARTIGSVALGAGGLGIGAHLVASVVSGRYSDHMLKGTETDNINPDLYNEEERDRLEELDTLVSEMGDKQKELEGKVNGMKGDREGTVISRASSYIKDKLKKKKSKKNEEDEEEKDRK